MHREEKGIKIMKTKKAVSSLDVAVLVKELQKELKGGWIDNIYSLDKNGLLFKIRKPKGELTYLIIEPGRRINLTEHFTRGGLKGRVQIFRRFLRNAKVLNVSQHEFERIIVFELAKSRSELKLVVELIPRGVIAAVDAETNRILVTDKDIAVKDRVVKPGEIYRFPPSFKDPRKLNVNEWLKKLKTGKSLGNGLVRLLGLPPEVVNEVLSVEQRSLRSIELNANFIVAIREKLLGFISSVINKPEASVILCNNLPVSFQPFIPKKLPNECNAIEFNLFNKAIDYYFTHLEISSQEEKRTERHRIEATLGKAQKDLQGLKQRLEKLKKDMEVFELHYPLIERAWKCVKEKIESKGWEGISACNVKYSDPSKGVFALEVNSHILEVKVTEELSSQFFDLKKKIRSLERKVKKAEDIIKSLKEKLSLEIIKEEKIKNIPKLVKKSAWYHQFHWVRTRNGYLAIGGRDAQQNEKVVRKYLEDNDIFVHATIHGGSAFIIKTHGEKPSCEDLRDVALMAASYSKGWNAGVGALDVFWVYGSQVSKSPPPGQYLPKGSFMIYGKKNFIRNVELKISIGIIGSENSTYEVVSGPEDLIANNPRTIAFITLIPGSLKPIDVSKKLISLVKGKYDLIGLEEIDIAIRVPGPSSIIREFVKKPS